MYYDGNGSQASFSDTGYHPYAQLSESADIDFGGEMIVQIATGHDHSCALNEAGKVRCWGNGKLGKLGYGNVDNVGTADQPSGRTVLAAGYVNVTSDPNVTVVQIDVDLRHSCAVLSNKKLVCWGSGRLDYRLGYNILTDVGAGVSPFFLPKDAGYVSVGNNSEGVVQVSCGEKHTCAMTVNGDIVCFGVGSHGQLGYGNPDDLRADQAAHVPLIWQSATSEPTTSPTLHPTGPESVLHMRLCVNTVPEYPALGDFEQDAVLRHFQDLIERTIHNESVISQVGLRNPDPILIHWDDDPPDTLAVCPLEQVTFLITLAAGAVTLVPHNFTKYSRAIAGSLVKVDPSIEMKPSQVRIIVSDLVSGAAATSGRARALAEEVVLQVAINTYVVGEAAVLKDIVWASGSTDAVMATADFRGALLSAMSREGVSVATISVPTAPEVSVPDLIAPTSGSTIADDDAAPTTPAAAPTTPAAAPTPTDATDAGTIPAGCFEVRAPYTPAPYAGTFSIDGVSYFDVLAGAQPSMDGIYCPGLSAPAPGTRRALRTGQHSGRLLRQSFSTPCLLVQVKREAGLNEVAKRALEPKIQPCLRYLTEAHNQSIEMTIIEAEWVGHDGWFTAYPTSSPTAMPTVDPAVGFPIEMWQIAIALFFIGLCLGVFSAGLRQLFCRGSSKHVEVIIDPMDGKATINPMIPTLVNQGEEKEEESEEESEEEQEEQEEEKSFKIVALEELKAMLDTNELNDELFDSVVELTSKNQRTLAKNGVPLCNPLAGPIAFKRTYMRVANNPPTSGDVGRPVKIEADAEAPSEVQQLQGNCYNIVAVQGQSVQLSVSKTEHEWVEFDHLSWIGWGQEPVDDESDGALYDKYLHVASEERVEFDPKDSMLALFVQVGTERLITAILYVH
jgi:hypothetical protein